jgi:hypothetical protein
MGIRDSIMDLVSGYHQFAVIIVSSSKETILSFHHMQYIQLRTLCQINECTYIWDDAYYDLCEMLYIRHVDIIYVLK